MIWLLSLAVALSTGVVAAVAGGYLAHLAVGWYGISSFEGQSGYTVILLAVVGLVGGGAIGLVVGRLVLAQPGAGFGRALLVSHAVVLLVVGLLGAAAWLRADTPPRIDGHALLVAVELRFPEGAPLPGEAGDEWFVRLASLSGGQERARMHGPLWREDARLENGRWIVPGAVDLYTTRGKRALAFEADGLIDHGFLMPLPARPGREFLEWSDWLPRAEPGAAPLPEGVRYRYRVVPAGEAVRTQAVGPFEIRSLAWGFSPVTFGDEPRTIQMAGHLRVLFHGRPLDLADAPPPAGEHATHGGVDGTERVRNVSVIPGPRPALVLQSRDRCVLAAEEPAGLRLEHLAFCDGLHGPAPLLKAFGPAPEGVRPRSVLPQGRVDHERFPRPGMYALQGAVLDTRTLTVRRFDPAVFGGRLVQAVAPLGVSPDGRSLARLRFTRGAAEGSAGDEYEVAVLDMATGTVDSVRYTGPSLRAADYERLDEEWLEHHFRWDRGTGGVDRLAAREGVVPRARRGRLTVDGSGYREYAVWPVATSMRPAMVDWLVAEFGAEPLPADETAFSHDVRIGGRTVHLSAGDSNNGLTVWMDRGADSGLVAEIAERFDAALATRRFDGHFLP